jgi:beta-glucosidase
VPRLLARYRFSLEWSRIEPAEGEFSLAARDRYPRMVDACLAADITPNVTLNHFTIPRWLDVQGGWRSPVAVDRFARFTEFIRPVVERDVEYVSTLNEPNITACMAGIGRGDTLQAAGLPAPDPQVADALTAAHHRAVEIVRSWGGPKVGWTVATQAFQPLPGAEDVATAYAHDRETRFLQEAKGGNWLGVQAYTRTLIGPEGPLPVADGVETTLTGWEYYRPPWGSVCAPQPNTPPACR